MSHYFFYPVDSQAGPRVDAEFGSGGKGGGEGEGGGGEGGDAR